jgi:hypothetical protein
VYREDGKRGEVFVDDVMHGAINQLILDYVDTPKVQPTLVLATGDGNNNHESMTTFPRSVSAALKRGTSPASFIHLIGCVSYS